MTDVREFSHEIGVVGLVDMMAKYQVGKQPLISSEHARSLMTKLVSAVRENSTLVHAEDLPIEDFTKMMLSYPTPPFPMEFYSGICLMSVIATGRWEVLKLICDPVFNATNPQRPSRWPAEFFLGVLLGFFESVVWLYGMEKHYFAKSGNLLAKYPPDFLADLLCSDQLNSEDAPFPEPANVFFGRLSNLIPSFIEGPRQYPEEHRTHLKYMLGRLHRELRTGSPSTSYLAKETAKRLAYKFFDTASDAEKLAMVGKFAEPTIR